MYAKPVFPLRAKNQIINVVFVGVTLFAMRSRTRDAIREYKLMRQPSPSPRAVHTARHLIVDTHGATQRSDFCSSSASAASRPRGHGQK
jgi:hypothetical protein